jgi:hypothetical protein
LVWFNTTNIITNSLPTTLDIIFFHHDLTCRLRVYFVWNVFIVVTIDTHLFPDKISPVRLVQLLSYSFEIPDKFSYRDTLRFSIITKMSFNLFQTKFSYRDVLRNSHQTKNPHLSVRVFEQQRRGLIPTPLFNQLLDLSPILGKTRTTLLKVFLVEVITP